MKIGFIDYSREERNKILATLKLLGEQTALDELGIGVVRDAYADILFPGISTLQTRAKYFVLLPYLFQSAGKRAGEGKLRNGHELLQWVNNEEDRIAGSLTKNCPNGEIGIIGSDAFRSKRSVKMKPSTIYWTGLRTFGIFLNDKASLSAACKMICAEAKRKSSVELLTDGESFDDATAADQGETLFCPIHPDYDYVKDVTIDLTRAEAEFLRERILHSPFSSDSLLAFLIREKMVIGDFVSVPENKLPDALRRDYQLAKDFSRFIYGAHIRYNVIYSDYTDQSMADAFDAWREQFFAEPFALEPVLERVSCPTALAGFCRAFLKTAEENDTAAMDDLIVRREIQVKGMRSKLRKPKEYCYDPEHPVHAYRLDYRFNRASVIIQDILKGLETGEHV